MEQRKEAKARAWRGQGEDRDGDKEGKDRGADALFHWLVAVGHRGCGICYLLDVFAGEHARDPLHVPFADGLLLPGVWGHPVPARVASGRGRALVSAASVRAVCGGGGRLVHGEPDDTTPVGRSASHRHEVAKWLGMGCACACGNPFSREKCAAPFRD